MKLQSRKLPFSTMVIVICTVAFTGLMFTEDLRAITGISISKLKSCTKMDPMTNSSKPSADGKEKTKTDDPREEGGVQSGPLEHCSIEKGKWVFNNSSKLFYTDESCRYLDKQVTCLSNGRPDTDYLNWEWLPDDCILPRFNGTDLLEKLRGKRLMFSGDSLQKGQWQSLICMVESHIPPDKKLIKRGRSHSVFKALDYNASIGFYWAPYLVESNSDEPIITDTKKRIIRVDSISKHARYWEGVDFLVFNSYVWWTSDARMKTLWGSFTNGEEGFEELEAITAYRMAIKTWANWVDSNLNQNITKVFFTTPSPTHMRSADWKLEKGIQCYNETRPVARKEYWGTGSNKKMMNVLSSIVARMKINVTFINVTQLSDYRKDGHASIYTGELADERKNNPEIHADCIHWCLPGIPDTWNQILYAYL